MSEEKSEKKNEIVKATNQSPAQVLKIQDQGQYLQTLIDSKTLPAYVKHVHEAWAIMQMGRDYGFTPLQSFQNLIPIQGKYTLTAKAIGGILKRNGVRFKTTEDLVYVYANGETSEERKPYVDGKDDPGWRPVNRRTTIHFKRKHPDGEIEEETVSFTWKDAEEQGLTTKDNWIRMKKAMMYARCMAKGANKIAPDLLCGLYSTDEMWDALGQKEKVRRDEDGTIVEVITEDVEHTVED